MKIAIIGLGKMGYQFVVKLHEDGHEVIAFDRESSQVEQAVSAGALGSSDRQDVVTKFDGSTPIIWLMIPSEAVDEELKQWVGILPKDSVVVDGGNSSFEKTIERAKTLDSAGIKLVDVGTSGGILGLDDGFCFMVGGDQAAYNRIEPVLGTLSKPSGAYKYFGPSGSGHFIKMVHNAIEYGYMESLSEGYSLLAEGPFKDLDLAEIGGLWQHGSIVKSKLNELTSEVLRENPKLDGIEGVVAATGEADWAVDEASKHQIKMPAIEASIEVRTRSQNGEVNFSTKLLASVRTKFGGHKINPK